MLYNDVPITDGCHPTCGPGWLSATREALDVCSTVATLTYLPTQNTLRNGRSKWSMQEDQRIIAQIFVLQELANIKARFSWAFTGFSSGRILKPLKNLHCR